MEISEKELRKLNMSEDDVFYTAAYFFGIIPSNLWVDYRSKASLKIWYRLFYKLKYRVTCNQ